jgi:hypothetical protein
MILGISPIMSGSNEVAVTSVFPDDERDGPNSHEAFIPLSQDILGTFGTSFQLDQFDTGPIYNSLTTQMTRL